MMASKSKLRSEAEAEADAVAARRAVLDSGLTMEKFAVEGDAGYGTKSRILDTAITLFAERGFEACTMRDLAEAVGIRAPAIYNHYPSKDEVLAAAMKHILGQFFWELLSPLENEPVDEWLESIVRGHILFQLEHPRHARANDALMGAPGIDRVLPKADFERIVGAQRHYIESIRALVELRARGLDRSDSLMAAFSIAATGDRVASWFDPNGPLTAEQVADRSWALVERMLGT